MKPPENWWANFGWLIESSNGTSSESANRIRLLAGTKRNQDSFNRSFCREWIQYVPVHPNLTWHHWPKHDVRDKYWMDIYITIWSFSSQRHIVWPLSVDAYLVETSNFCKVCVRILSKGLTITKFLLYSLHCILLLNRKVFLLFQLRKTKRYRLLAEYLFYLA